MDGLGNRDDNLWYLMILIMKVKVVEGDEADRVEIDISTTSILQEKRKCSGVKGYSVVECSVVYCIVGLNLGKKRYNRIESFISHV